MAFPKTYRALRRLPSNMPGGLEVTTEHSPESLAPKDVLLKIHAVSINWQDVATLYGKFLVKSMEQGIAASDCAAKVVAIWTRSRRL